VSDGALMSKLIENKDSESSDEDDSAAAIGFSQKGAQFMLKSPDGHMSNPEGPIRTGSLLARNSHNSVSDFKVSSSILEEDI